MTHFAWANGSQLKCMGVGQKDFGLNSIKFKRKEQ